MKKQAEEEIKGQEEAKAQAEQETPAGEVAGQDIVVDDETVLDEEAGEIEAVEKDGSESGDIDEELARKDLKKRSDIAAWKPKTELGREVKLGKVRDIDLILDSGKKIMEHEITDALLENLDSDLLLIGQSKGKFGGGQRRVFRQTQKKTKEGNRPSFSTFAIIGNKDGYLGYGYGKAKETVPAREKAMRKAKLNIMKIKRGCGSWQCHCATPHSIPFSVEGKCGAYRIRLKPAPKGTGLCVEKELAKILDMAGIRDVWAKSTSKTKSKLNMALACIDALDKLTQTKVRPRHIEKLGITSGKAAA